MTRKLTEGISVTGQIGPEDVAGLAAQGFKSIICNRPDGEDAEQPPFVAIEHAAASIGLAVRFVPVEAGRVTDADVAAFTAACAQLPKPILAYCRSGARSTKLWELAQALLRASAVEDAR